MPSTTAGPEIAGKTCPFCQTAIKPNDHVHICDACNNPHHIECWQQNGGCTTFGCQGANTVASQHQQPRAYQPHQPQYYAPPTGYTYDVPPDRGEAELGSISMDFFLVYLA